jgi:hypothetical protein
MNEPLEPKDHAEKVALFGAQVLGPLLCVDLGKRELTATLRELSLRRYTGHKTKSANLRPTPCAAARPGAAEANTGRTSTSRPGEHEESVEDGATGMAPQPASASSIALVA